MSNGRPEVERSLPSHEIPSTASRQWAGPSHLDNEFSSRELLSPLVNSISRSETGRSVLTFASIESIHDGGISKMSAFEHQLFQTHPSVNDSTRTKHHKTRQNTTVTTESLSEEFWEKAEIPPTGASDKFLPLDKLKDLVNPSSVREILETLVPKPDVERLVQGIFAPPLHAEHHYPQQKQDYEKRPSLYRIFAILVGIDRVADIQKFIDQQIDDSVLPVNIPTEKERLEGNQLHSLGNPHMNDGRLSRCFDDYSSTKISYFNMYQRLVNVPFFLFPGDDSSVCFYELERSCILPITDIGKPKVSGNSSVKRVTIHHAHHNYGGIRKERPDNYFAVKTLHLQNNNNFQQEVEAFERLSPKSKDKSPDHLVHLELAYRHGEECCLVFPWASGNLREYWKWHQKDPGNYKHVVWFFKQCRGLSLGLRRLHNPGSYALTALGNNSSVHTANDILGVKYGRHGDIKPENILWFNNYNGDTDHLAICDFGSAKFNNLDTKSHVDANGVCGYSKTYQPPDSHTDPKVNQRFDIWSLGCVFLEFVSWFLLGYGPLMNEFIPQRMIPNPEYPEDVYKEDRFFHFVHSTGPGGRREAMVNPAVLNWITKLHGLEQCPESIHKFLDLIQFQMLQPSASNRGNSVFVRGQLRDIYDKCCKNVIYARAGYAKMTKQSEIQDPEMGRSEHRTFNHQSDIYPKLSDEMLGSIPPHEQFQQEIGGDSEEPDSHKSLCENMTIESVSSLRGNDSNEIIDKDRTVGKSTPTSIRENPETSREGDSPPTNDTLAPGASTGISSQSLMVQRGIIVSKRVKHIFQKVKEVGKRVPSKLRRHGGQSQD